MRASVFPLVEVGHDAVDDVGLGGEEVQGFCLSIRFTAVGDLLNVWSKSEPCGGSSALAERLGRVDGYGVCGTYG